MESIPQLAEEQKPVSLRIKVIGLFNPEMAMVGMVSGGVIQRIGGYRILAKGHMIGLRYAVGRRIPYQLLWDCDIARCMLHGRTVAGMGA